MHHLEYSIAFGNEATGVSSNSNSWGIYRNIVSAFNGPAGNSNISLAQAGATPADFRVDNIFAWPGGGSIAGQGGDGGRTVRTDALVAGMNLEPHSIYIGGRNDLHRDITADFFVCLDMPLALTLFARGPAPFVTDPFGFDHDIAFTPGSGTPASAIDLGGFLELTRYAFQHDAGAVIDLDELREVLEEAEEITNPALFTPETWAAFVAARDAAQAVYDDPYATQWRVDRAAEALRDAIDELERRGTTGGGGGGGGGGPLPTPTPPAPDFPFVDVPENAWYREYVEQVWEMDLMNGISDTEFAPHDNLSRAMTATILYRLAGEPTVNFSPIFSDVRAGRWYSNAIVWAAQNEIVLGVGGGRFDPTANVTREQMATMLFRYAEFMDFDTSVDGWATNFVDAHLTSRWALEALQWANANDLIRGQGGNRVNPGGTATRAERAAIIVRFVDGFK